MRTLLTVLFLLVLSGCAATGKDFSYANELPNSDEKVDKYLKLSGLWYGEIKTDNGTHRRWLNTISPTGYYKIEFRSEKPSGEVQINFLGGQWGLAGDIQFTITQAEAGADGEFKDVEVTNPFNGNAYKILLLDEENYHYQGLDSGTIFKVKRVDDSFTW